MSWMQKMVTILALSIMIVGCAVDVESGSNKGSQTSFSMEGIGARAST